MMFLPGGVKGKKMTVFVCLESHLCLKTMYQTESQSRKDLISVLRLAALKVYEKTTDQQLLQTSNV